MSHARRTVSAVAERRIWKPAEIEAMEPEERQRLFDERIVTDLSEIDPVFLERARAHGRKLMEERGLIPRQDEDD
jgi:hypothetical protein